MYAMVDENECIGCGSCEALAPEVFQINDDGKAEAYAEANDDNKASVEEAMEMCPMKCISWDE